jgi:hypothetical protein
MKTIRITFKDETETEYLIELSDTLAFERQTGKSVLDLESDKPLMSDWLWMCWRQAKRENAQTKPFDMWLETIGDVNLTNTIPKG